MAGQAGLEPVAVVLVCSRRSFWQKALANGSVMLLCTGRDGDNVQHRANTCVQIVPRDAKERRALNRWQRLAALPDDAGPSPGAGGGRRRWADSAPQAKR